MLWRYADGRPSPSGTVGGWFCDQKNGLTKPKLSTKSEQVLSCLISANWKERREVQTTAKQKLGKAKAIQKKWAKNVLDLKGDVAEAKRAKITAPGVVRRKLPCPVECRGQQILPGDKAKGGVVLSKRSGRSKLSVCTHWVSSPSVGDKGGRSLRRLPNIK